jgi:predicted membrane-bound spermidine synthase
MVSATIQKGGTFAPLRGRTFRTIWTASVFSNFGQMVLGVGAAWEMTQLTSSPSMVALVQTAMMLPLMLVALPAGALADMFDQRKIAMVGLTLSMVFAALLTAFAFAGLTTPWVLLIFCSLIGGGVALFAPAWQDQLQYRPQRGASNRRVDCACGGLAGGVCGECRFLHPADFCFLFLEA